MEASKMTRTLSLETTQQLDGSWTMRIRLKGTPVDYTKLGYASEDDAFTDIPKIIDILERTLGMTIKES